LPIGVLEALTIPFWPFVVPLVFGLGYKPAVSGVQILMGATAIRSLFFWLNSFYYASGNISVWVKGFFIQTVLLISLGWLAIQYAGFSGMVLVYALVGLAFTLVMAGVALQPRFLSP
jgi:O-antigen/teichoic acid export membrane protein